MHHRPGRGGPTVKFADASVTVSLAEAVMPSRGEIQTISYWSVTDSVAVPVRPLESVMVAESVCAPKA